MIIIRFDAYEEISKSLGIKNYSKLTKKRIIDKNGHSRFVWVKNEVDLKYERNILKDTFYTITNNGKKSAEIGFKFIKEKVQDEKIKELFSLFYNLGANFDTFKSTTGTPAFHPPKRRKKSYIELHSIKNIEDKENIMTFVHECTHYFDYYCNDYPFSYTYSMNEEFMNKYKIEELPSDIENYQNKIQNKINELDRQMENLPNNLSQDKLLEKIIAIKQELEESVMELKIFSNPDFYDFFNCLSEGNILKSSNHNSEYFTNVKPLTECLAIYVSFKAIYPKALDIINEIKPGIIDDLNIIFDNILNKAKKWSKK